MRYTLLLDLQHSYIVHELPLLIKEELWLSCAFSDGFDLRCCWNVENRSWLRLRMVQVDRQRPAARWYPLATHMQLLLISRKRISAFIRQHIFVVSLIVEGLGVLNDSTEFF